jgi:hypothetical protein
VPAALVPLAVVLLAWLPGRAAAQWCVATTGTSLAPRRLSPFPEILLGLCLWSWIGLLLAELGEFSPLGVGAILGALALGLAVASRRAGARAERAGWGSAAAGLAIAVLAGALYSPPYETIVMASDATVYFSTGVHLGRAGSISVPDPLMAELDLDARTALLPLGTTVGWTRLPGGLLVPSRHGEVMWPTYSHLLPVWVATFTRLGGLAAGGLVGTTFAVLALWAVFLLAREIAGPLAATAATVLTATSVAEVFYARFLMPEIVAQLFLWGGLLAFVVWWRDGPRSAGALAALGLGVAGLARVEYLVLVPLALLFTFLLVERRPPGTGVFAALYLVLLAHGVAHLSLVPTHYRDVLQDEAAALGPSAIAGVVGAAVAIGAALLVRGPGWPRALRGGAALALVVAGLAAVADRPHPDASQTLSWLAGGTPWPVLVLGGVGLVLAIRRVRDDASLALPLLLFAVATGSFLWDPHVTPTAIWGLRRFVPVTLPLVCLLAMTALPWRLSTALAVVMAAALIAVNARPTVRLRRLPLFPDQKRELAALAEEIDPEAAVFFATDLAEYGIHLPLWLAHGRETFLLPPWGWQRALRTAAATLLPRHPVYYVGDAADADPAVGGLELTPRGEIAFRFVLPGSDPMAVPSATREWPLVLRLYAVRAAPPP